MKPNRKCIKQKRKRKKQFDKTLMMKPKKNCVQ